MRYYSFFALLYCFLMSGCAHVFSDENLRLANPSIKFINIRQKPDAYIGKTVILGGMIASVQNKGEGGVMEIVQFNLSKDYIPKNIEESGGRFLATTPGFLDPAQYSTGQLVTVIGEVKGKKIQPIDGVDYAYPVISIKEIHGWYNSDQEQALPSDYDPYYWGYPGDPYRFRPIGTPYKRF